MTDHITIKLKIGRAEEIDFALSDFLCWQQGFNAALGPGDYDRTPLGVEGIRAIRIALNDALIKAKSAEEGGDE